MSNLNELGRRLKAVEKKVSRGVSQPQLAYSSIEDGNVQEYDRDGTLVGIIGLQHDGTHVAASVNGPVPPTPAIPVAEDGPGGITVSHTGLFEMATDVAPMDFLRFDVHTSTVSGFTYDPAVTLRASFSSPRGGKVFIPLPAGTHYVRIVCVTASGKYSSGSIEDSAVAGAGTGVLTYWQETPPTAFTVGDLWYETDNGNLLHRWDGANWIATPVGGGAIDIGTVTSSNTQFRPGGGMLQNLIPDPGFVDADWRAKRQAEDGWAAWDFQTIANLIPSTQPEWNLGPKTASMTFYTDATDVDSYFDFEVSSDTVAGDVLGYTDPIPVEANFTYQLFAGWDNSTKFDITLTWKDAALVDIGAPIVITTGLDEPTGHLSPAAAAFAVITYKADAEVFTTVNEADVNGLQFYWGGAGVLPGTSLAHVSLPAMGAENQIILARNLPVGTLQQYFASYAFAVQQGFLSMGIRLNKVSGSVQEYQIVSGSALVGHSGTFQTDRGYIDLDPSLTADVASYDLVMNAIPNTATPYEVWFTEPAIVATGFSTMDGQYQAIFSPAYQIMQGDEIQVFIDSFSGFAMWQTTSSVTFEPMEMGMSRSSGNIYWDVGLYASMEMSGSVWKVDTGDLATNQNQHLELNGVTKLASLKNGLNGKVEVGLTETVVQGDSVYIGTAASRVKVVGDTVTEGKLDIGVKIGQYDQAGADVSTAANSTSYAATGLFFSVLANAIYELEADLIFDSNGSAANTKILPVMPAGATYTGTAYGPLQGATTSNAAPFIHNVRGAVSTPLVVGSPATGYPAAGDFYVVRVKCLIDVGATAGTVQLWFGQNTAGGAGVVITMKSLSWLTARRLA